MTEQIDMDISGAGTMPGGVYRDVNISGAGKVEGNLRCRSLDISGSGKISGDVVCDGAVDSSGAGKICGRLTAESLDCSGAFTCEGDCELKGLLDASGATKVRGSIRADRIDVSGVLNCGGDVSAEEFTGSCVCQIDGLLNAERIALKMEGNCRIGDVGGASICIKSRSHGLLFMVRQGILETNTVEGDTIELESTLADVVRGRDVTIGSGCRIRRVEYGESFDRAPDAVIDELIQLPTGPKRIEE